MDLLAKTKRHSTISLLIITMGIMLSACQNEAVIPEITPSYDYDSLTTYESSEQGISFKYPEDWFVYDGSLVIISLNENNLSDENIFLYTNWSTGYRPKLPISGTATGYANSQIRIALNPGEYGPSTIIQDVQTITVNGRDGATFIIERKGYIEYSVIVEITKYRIVHIFGGTDTEGLEEMKNIVNTIAYYSQALDE